MRNAHQYNTDLLRQGGGPQLGSTYIKPVTSFDPIGPALTPYLPQQLSAKNEINITCPE